MASHGQKFTYRIGRREVKQGRRPSEGNQAEVDKSATGTNSPIILLTISTPRATLKVALMKHHLTIPVKPVDKNGPGESTKKSWKLSM